MRTRREEKETKKESERAPGFSSGEGSEKDRRNQGRNEEGR